MIPSNVDEEVCLEFTQGIYVGQTQAKRVGIPTYKQMHGLGTFLFSNGDQNLNGKVYTGSFYNGVESGFGILKCHDVVIYEGSWAKGKRHGHGVSFSGDGNKLYDGEWKYDMKLMFL